MNEYIFYSMKFIWITIFCGPFVLWGFFALITMEDKRLDKEFELMIHLFEFKWAEKYF